MDISYEHGGTWELSDSDPGSDVHPGSVNTLDSNDHPNPLPPILDSTGAGLLSGDEDINTSSLCIKGRSLLGEGMSADSDSESCGSSSGGLLATFPRDEASEEDEEEDEGENSTATTCKETSTQKENSKGRGGSSVVLSSLRKSWKRVKRTSVLGTSAGKQLSSISSTYFGSRIDVNKESWEERHSRMGDEWVASILPSWHKKRKTTRVRTLVFRGIPANVRGRAWQCAIGNPLNVSEDLFEVLKERAYTGRMEYIRGREIVAMADGDVGGNGGKAETMMESERSAHKAIMLDLPRTFPDLSFFHAEGSHYEYALRDVLEAFLYLKPDVGYSQGMSFLAAVLLLYMEPYEAFSCFVNMLLHKSCFLNFFKIKMPEVRVYMMVHEKLMSEEMPNLYSHFKQYGIESDLYMINWVMSLYCRALPLDLVTRIWDLYVLDGDVAIFRAALGILRLFMPRLLKMKFEQMAYFLSHIPGEEIKADQLLQSIRAVRVVTKKRFKDLFKEYEANCHREERAEEVEHELNVKRIEIR